MSMISSILSWLSGSGVVKQFTDPLIEAYKAKLAATNDKDRLEAEKTITRIEASRDIALVEAGKSWSATSVGRWLIVVPFGLWWSAIFVIQLLNPWLFNPVFGFNAVVVEVPPDIMDMAKILVPAIVIADAGAFAVGKIGNSK